QRRPAYARLERAPQPSFPCESDHHDAKMLRMRIAVVCGGESSERDVSKVSGWAVARALTERGHEVWVIDPSADQPVLASALQDPAQVPDVAVPRTPPSADDQPELRRRAFAALTGAPLLPLLREVDLAFLAVH